MADSTRGNPGPAQAVARITEKLGKVLFPAGQFDEALRAFQVAGERYRCQGDLDSCHRVVALAGRVYARLGRPREGLDLIGDALQTADEASSTCAALESVRAELCFYAGRYREQVVASRRAAQLARDVGDWATVASADVRLGIGLNLLGESADVLEVLDEGARLAEEVGDFDSLCRALNAAASVYLYRGEFDRVRFYFERGLAAARRLQDPSQIAFITGNLGFISYFDGRWAEARRIYEQAFALCGQVGAASSAAATVLSSGFALLCTGEGALDQARAHAETSLAAARKSGDLQVVYVSSYSLAHCDLAEDQPARARDLLSPLLPATDAEDRDVTTFARPPLALALLALGEVERAREIVTRGVALARSTGNRLALVELLGALGPIEARRERWEDAENALVEAVALARRMPYPLAEARALLAAGRIDLERGKSSAARTRLVRARAIFRRLGAHRDLALVEATLGEREQLWERRFGRRIDPDQWERVIARVSLAPPGGRTRGDERRILEAILYLRSIGGRWVDLPPEFGDDSSVHRCYQEWRASGAWGQVCQILGIDPGETRKGVTGDQRVGEETPAGTSSPTR